MKVTVIRTNRKTLALQVNSDLSVTVRAPRCATDKEIECILKEKNLWIQKHIEQFRKKKAQLELSDRKPFTKDEIQALAKEAVQYIPKRVEYFAEIVGVNYGRITIRNQKTRWGSCSGKGNLNFNCFLMLLEPKFPNASRYRLTVSAAACGSHPPSSAEDFVYFGVSSS